MTTHSNFTGTWRADLAASKLRGPEPNEIVASIRHAEPELGVVMTIIDGDDTPARMAFDVRTTGDASMNTVLGSEWISRSRWVGRELLIESDVDHAGRKMHFRDYWSISDDGQRLTMEHRGDDLDGQITVLDRVESTDEMSWQRFYTGMRTDLTPTDRFYHGTRADLKPGDLIAPGYPTNFGQLDRVTTYVYFAATLDAGVWGAELARGEGRSRIYIVEPTGPFTDDPNLTDKRFPGNPTKSYRSRAALQVLSECTEWQGHPPEMLQHMKEHIARLKELGVEPLDD